MAIKNILVAYNGGAASDAALHLGVQMAHKYDAHLTGIMAHGISSTTRHMPAWLSAHIRQSIEETFEGHGADVRRRFHEQVTANLTADRTHWLEVEDDPDRSVATFARVFDITLVGQYENLPEQDAMLLHPDRIAYDAARPVIIAPKSYKAERLNERAVIAWDGGKTAARAMMDAMHVLETKEFVSVVTIGEDCFNRIPKRLDICALLARHGIRAEHQILPLKREGAAATLLDYCDTSDFGLLVMGAYERAKFAEDLTGGFTQRVLRNITLPTFVSH
mgnify:FL=1